MTRRPIPFSGSAFFLALRLRRADAWLLATMQRPPARRARCGSAQGKSPREKPHQGPGSSRDNALPAPVPHSDPALRERYRLFLSLLPLKAAPFSAPVLPGEPPRRGSAMCPARPDSDSTHLRADRGSGSVRLGFSPRSGSESGPLPSSFRTPPQPFSPPPSPAPGPADKKSPGSAGQNMKKGNSKGGSAKAPLKKTKHGNRRAEEGGRAEAQRERALRRGRLRGGGKQSSGGMRENESSKDRSGGPKEARRFKKRGKTPKAPAATRQASGVQNCGLFRNFWRCASQAARPQ